LFDWSWGRGDSELREQKAKKEWSPRSLREKKGGCLRGKNEKTGKASKNWGGDEKQDKKAVPGVPCCKKRKAFRIMDSSISSKESLGKHPGR